ncbi:MAG: nitrate reductase [Gammaproteobacteria bacterium]|jgi:anaerobic selenocysteine-containing dehydrogenase|nr:nitrate reductase [Gammaproteobacteria bacterium]MBT3723760.1 nitrate reductase [Gammaproteobacteria bacterium]MBT4077382.1 nitrate reductase [Gammaproteobacteria bacterium]MBT4196446.1 nitrate reductase [Gammaproteobacteria bacterium]MBT4448133.1 nitrate reductase [Gammaproteobacteria bacterium]
MAENETQDSVAVFTIDEIEELKKDPNIANHNRRSFLKWSAIVSSQAVIGGGLVNLLASSEVNADDTFDNVTDWVYSVCGYCSFGCGLNIGVNAAGEAVAVRGNENHPTNNGRVCVKGLYEHKILDAPDRGKWPLIRDVNGDWKKITWDEATTILSQKIIDGVDDKGADSIATYNTGQWTLEEYYAFGKLGKGAIGTGTMDSNTRLCMAAAVVGYLTTFGSDGPPGCYDDIENTDCFFVIGMNPAEMHPQLWRRIAKARRTVRAPKLIVVDPRRTQTARSADLHLALKPGTNLALMNGLVQQIIINNWTDSNYINNHTRNYDAMADVVAKYTPEYVSNITGCPADDIKLAAKWIGESPEALSLFIQGVYQSMGATDTVRMICAMHLIMGKIGRPGSSPFSITGQATAMSNREAGASSALAGYRNYYNPDHVGELEDFWNIPKGKIPPHKPTVITSNRDYQDINSQVEMMRNGELSLFWIQCTNPAVTLPDLNKLYSYMDFDNPKRPYIVVQDIYQPMECTHFADMFLPAAMWGEKSGVYTCSERKVNLGRQAVLPVGHDLRADGYGAYSDLDITKMVADKIASMDARFADRDGNSVIGFNTSEEAFEEWKTCTEGTICDMSGMSYEAIQANNGIQWPSTPDNIYGGTRMYTNGRFNTNWADTQGGTQDKAWVDPDNKSRAYLWAKDYLEAPEIPDSEYPFWLITGRVIEHFHSRTKTKRVPQLHEMVPKNYVELHPDDAASLNVTSGDMVRLNTRRGEIVIKALVVGTVQRGQVFVPMHFADLDPQDVAQNGGRLTATNRLTMNWVDPDCKQPIYKHCAVSLTRA